MHDLSVTQELVMILLSEGREVAPWGDFETPASLVSASLLELVQVGALALPKNPKPTFWDDSSHLELREPIPAEPSYLAALAAIIHGTENQTMQELVYKLFTDFDDKALMSYIDPLLADLQSLGLVSSQEKTGFRGRIKTAYKADEVSSERIIQNLRANLLEEGKPEHEAVVLAILLDKLRLLKRYFSEHEHARTVKRLEEFKQDPANSVLKEVMEVMEVFYAIILSLIVTTMM